MAAPPPSLSFAALVFDLDGTVLRSHELIAQTVNLVLGRQGHPSVDPGQVMALSGLPLETIFEAVLPAAAAEQALACCTDYRTIFERDVVPTVQPIPGAPEALARIAATGRWSLAIATGRYSTTARAMLRVTGLEHHFQGIAGIDLVARPKPYPDVLFRALDDLGGLPATEVLVIGDTAADVAMSLAAGARVCAVTWGAQPRDRLLEAQPHWCVDTWDDLLALLDARAAVNA